MSGFFSFLAAVAFFAALFFYFRNRKTRRHRQTWLAAGAFVVLASLSSATRSPAERAAAAAREASEAKAAQIAAVPEPAAKPATPPPPKQAEAIDSADLIVHCQQMARSRLKLPDTARFPGWMEMVDSEPTISPTRASWSSWVESENNFGGKVRTRFNCVYTKADNTARMTFDSE